MGKQKKHKSKKSKLHPRNKHRERYNFDLLTSVCPDLAPHINPNKYGNASIDFFNPEAVKMLNKALLIHHYGIEYWDIPDGYLCPPIPGRADHLHHVADLLAEYNNGKIPKGSKIKCMDIGTGANCIYPIIGNREYGWSFIGADVDSKAIESAIKIIDENLPLKGKIELRHQRKISSIFHGIFKDNETIDFTICNPPFYTSEKEAEEATQRKVKKLKKESGGEVERNFAGKNNELWYDGGELKFIRNMISESVSFSTSCFWFTTLVSKKENLKSIYEQLKEDKALEVKTIEMTQGNKLSRIVAWTFLNKKQQEAWRKYRWK